MKLRTILFNFGAISLMCCSQLSAHAGPWQDELNRLESLPDNHITRSMKKLAEEKAAEERQQENQNQQESETSTQSSESGDTGGSNVISHPGCETNPLILC